MDKLSDEDGGSYYNIAAIKEQHDALILSVTGYHGIYLSQR